MSTLYVIRHASTPWNETGLIQGHRDVPLSERGRAEAAACRPTLAVTHKGVLRVLLVAATGWDMSGKPPVRLLPATMHRFALDASGTPTLVRCNIPLAAAAAL